MRVFVAAILILMVSACESELELAAWLDGNGNANDKKTETDGLEESEQACKDALDNDNDGLIDCQEKSCGVLEVCGGSGIERTAEECRDGFDNDQDGLTDCEDRNCRVYPSCK